MFGRYWLECLCGEISTTHPVREELLEAARTAPLLELLHAELVWDVRQLALVGRHPCLDLARFLADHWHWAGGQRGATGRDSKRHGLVLVGRNAGGQAERLEVPPSRYAKLAARVKRYQEGSAELEAGWDDELPRGKNRKQLVSVPVADVASATRAAIGLHDKKKARRTA